jgi:hypothetical protein
LRKVRTPLRSPGSVTPPKLFAGRGTPPWGWAAAITTTFASKIVVARGDTMTDEHAISDIPWIVVYSTMLVALMLLWTS